MEEKGVVGLRIAHKPLHGIKLAKIFLVGNKGNSKNILYFAWSEFDVD